MSDHHDFNWEAFHRDTAGIIARYGRTIIGVGGGDAGEPPFSYSIGNHLKGLPELLIIGSCQAPYLNEMSRLMIARGRPFDEGELVKTLTLLLPMNAHHVGARVAWDEYCVQAGEHLGHDDYSLTQMVLSDKEGRFPGDDGCQEPWASLPVLGSTLTTLSKEG